MNHARGQSRSKQVSAGQRGGSAGAFPPPTGAAGSLGGALLGGALLGCGFLGGGFLSRSLLGGALLTWRAVAAVQGEGCFCRGEVVPETVHIVGHEG